MVVVAVGGLSHDIGQRRHWKRLRGANAKHGREDCQSRFFWAFILFTVARVPIGFTQAGIDWKFYGGASVDGAVQEPGNQIRVWTKCLPQEALDHVDTAGKMTEDAAQKIRDGYVPPIVVAGDMKFDQVPDIVGYEEIANLGDIQPQSRIFYEIGCSERMIRELSSYIEAKGKVGSSDTPKEWQHVAPETNGARLLKILCQK
jgi:hypothetical protein